MIRVHLLAIVAWVVMPSVFAAGCSVNVAPPPRVTFMSSVTPGPNGENCNRDTASFLSVGSFGDVAQNETARSVESGGEERQWSVSTSCSVLPRNDGFDVAAAAQLIGHGGAIFRVQGFFVPNAEPQPNIQISLWGSEDRYVGRNCVARYATEQQTVAAGRVWAEVTCPTATTVDRAKRHNNQPISCHAVVTLRFENCRQ